MNHDMIKDWFSCHPITPLNIFTISMILSEQNYNNDKLLHAKQLYREIVKQLVDDKKVSMLESNQLTLEYDDLLRKGIIDNYSTIVCDLTNNPNLINMNKWIPDNNIGRIKNRCFPCKNKSKRR